jgi:hypothetical protein
MLKAKIYIELIMLYLAKKHFGAIAIHFEINNLFGEGIVNYSMITRYFRKRSFADSSEELKTKESDPIENAILQTLDKQPFASLRQLIKRILTPMTTVQYYLVNKMRYKVKHCKCVPHKPSAAQKKTRVTASACLLDLLRLIYHEGWKYIVTIDKIRFYFSNQHEQIGIPEEENPQQSHRTRSAIPKQRSV